MSQIRAGLSGRGWKVEVLDAPSSVHSQEARFAETGHVLDYPADASNVWQLELAKCDVSLSSDDMAALAQFVAGCIAAPLSVHVLDAWNGVAFKRATQRMLKAAGQRVVGFHALQAGTVLAGMRASAIAAALIAIAAAKLLLERGDCLPSDRPWLALFGDRSTRDSPLLRAAAKRDVSAAAPAILLLGRPRVSVAEAKALWRTELGVEPFVCRPVSIPSLLSALACLTHITRRGISASLASYSVPSATELAGIHYRVLFGHASTIWQRHQATPSAVVYGHTGLAHTSLLERAQQAQGAVTIHLVHGVSMGRNFMGYSDTAIFQCSHDAAWHDRLGGYAACVSPVMQTPALIPEGYGLLLLSNLIHSINPDFQHRGIAAELELLEVVSRCAMNAGLPARDVTWKPHPSFAGQSPVVRSGVISKVDELGFRHWPDGHDLGHAREFRVIVSTRSTVLLDLLRLGKLGVLVDLSAARPDGTAVGRLPLVARTATELDVCISSIMDDATLRTAYARAWNDIGPGRTDLCMEQIIELARDRMHAGLR